MQKYAIIYSNRNRLAVSQFIRNFPESTRIQTMTSTKWTGIFMVGAPLLITLALTIPGTETSGKMMAEASFFMMILVASGMYLILTDEAHPKNLEDLERYRDQIVACTIIYRTMDTSTPDSMGDVHYILRAVALLKNGKTIFLEQPSSVLRNYQNAEGEFAEHRNRLAVNAKRFAGKIHRIMPDVPVSILEPIVV